MNIQTNTGKNVDVNQFPDICPYCHHAMAPIFINSSLSGDETEKGTFLDAAFECTHLKCARLFIGIYKRTAMERQKMVGVFKFRKAAPLRYLPPIIPEEVKKISPSFVIIFGQATKAESLELGEIAGVGYRKALDF